MSIEMLMEKIDTAEHGVLIAVTAEELAQIEEVRRLRAEALRFDQVRECQLGEATPQPTPAAEIWKEHAALHRDLHEKFQRIASQGHHTNNPDSGLIWDLLACAALMTAEAYEAQATKMAGK